MHGPPRPDSRVVHVDAEPASLELVTSEGVPVFPIRGAEQRRRFETACELHGLRTRDCRGRAAGPSLAAVGGEVVASFADDPEAQSAASLYAHLTGRTSVVLASVGAAARHDTLCVVLVARKTIDLDLLEALQPTATRRCHVGLVFPTARSPLEEQVVLRALAAFAPAPADRPVVVERIAPIRGGTPPSAAEVQRSLSAGASVLVLDTHMDGVDAFLGDAALCSVVEGEARLPAERQPPCRATGRCHRLDIPLANIGHDPRILAPASVRARILVLQTCWGVMAEPSAVDPRWSLAHRLLDNPAVGAIVAPWNIVVTDADTSRPLVDDLVEGDALGDAAGRLATRPDIAGAGIRFALVGDPRARVGAPRPERSEPLAPRSTSASVPDSSRATNDDVDPSERDRTFLLHLLRGEYNSVADPAARSRCEEAFRAVQAFDVARADTVATMHERCFDYFGKGRGAIFTMKQWMALTSTPRLADQRPCSACDARAQVLTATLRIPGHPVRETVNCVHCGISYDGWHDPSRTPPRLVFAGDRIRLLADDEPGDRAAVIACPVDKRPREPIWWNRDADDRRHDLVLPRHWSETPYKLVLLRMHGARIETFQRPIFGGEPAMRVPA